MADEKILDEQIEEEVDQTEEKAEDQANKETKEPGEELFTKAQVEAIVKDRVARVNKAADKKVEEAAKLAKMNEQEKIEYEQEQLRKELEEYKRKEQYHELSKEASKMMAEKGIIADDALLQVLVTEEAETTHNAVKSFLSLFEAKVQEGVKVALSGTPPKANTKRDQVENPWSKDTFNLTKQGELVKSNPTLAAQLRAAAK